VAYLLRVYKPNEFELNFCDAIWIYHLFQSKAERFDYLAKFKICIINVIQKRNSILIVEYDIMQVSESELCCICFEQVCTIEVQNCGHQMCAQCTLALCCYNKPNPTTTSITPPVCPFCRSNIVRLMVVMKIENHDETDQDSVDINCSKINKSRKLRNLNDSGSSSFKGLSSVSFGKLGGRSSGRVAAEWIDKEWCTVASVATACSILKIKKIKFNDSILV